MPGAPPSRAYLLGSEGHFIVVGTYTDSPITVSLAEQKQRLYAFVDPSSPPQLSRSACCLPAQVVEAPGTAPGSDPFIARAFIAIAGKPAWPI